MSKDSLSCNPHLCLMQPQPSHLWSNLVSSILKGSNLAWCPCRRPMIKFRSRLQLRSRAAQWSRTRSDCTLILPKRRLTPTDKNWCSSMNIWTEQRRRCWDCSTASSIKSTCSINTNYRHNRSKRPSVTQRQTASQTSSWHIVSQLSQKISLSHWKLINELTKIYRKLILIE